MPSPQNAILPNTINQPRNGLRPQHHPPLQQRRQTHRQSQRQKRRRPPGRRTPRTVPPPPTSTTTSPATNNPRYEVATDEFEIASDSTSNATIYAASDRESARDALNQLLVVYSLYTTEVTAPEFQELQKQQEPQQGKQANVEGETSRVVATNFNPVEVSDVARAEVKRRVGQRVRELRSAVEVLEERAKED